MKHILPTPSCGVLRHCELKAPRENGCSELVNGMLWDELLITVIFYALKETDVLIENWRATNTTRSDVTVQRLQTAGAGNRLARP
ncbi:MAG: hypothetical protein OXK82_08405 [Deltaproteobacteria bacterium]|nr:hypothetical protein [Deltaproteobacteria bacterium]